MARGYAVAGVCVADLTAAARTACETLYPVADGTYTTQCVGYAGGAGPVFPSVTLRRTVNGSSTATTANVSLQPPACEMVPVITVADSVQVGWYLLAAFAAVFAIKRLARAAVV